MSDEAGLEGDSVDLPAFLADDDDLSSDKSSFGDGDDQVRPQVAE